MTVFPVVLAGGRGTRLWPLSRADKPKQFLPLQGDRSLFFDALQRHRGRPGIAEPWVICGQGDRFAVEDTFALAGISDAKVLLEPAGRNTAPAIAAAAKVAFDKDPEAVLLVLPSDHMVRPDDGYFASLDAALENARAGGLVTFGIEPTSPETGYGYIKASGSGPVRPVDRFIEKPAADVAAAMLAEGGYFWNAGFFAFSARTVLEELEVTAPDVVRAAVAAVDGAHQDGNALRLGEEAFMAAPEISIDYALLERTNKSMVAPLSCGWSDVGSWQAYWDSLEKDADGNAVRGKGLAIDSKDSLLISDQADVIALGLTDTAVIATPDAILVAPLHRAQDVKTVVSTLNHIQRSDLLEVSPTVNRPWGGYTSIMNGDRFQVKHLFVAPGKRLSLQKHHHRSEHWIVVRGTAEVTIDDAVITLSENQSTYIPLGAVHRLENPGKIQLEVIEVQTGSYLGEDDIIRLQDEYGRS